MRENPSTKEWGCPRVERLTEVKTERSPDTSPHEPRHEPARAAAAASFTAQDRLGVTTGLGQGSNAFYPAAYSFIIGTRKIIGTAVCLTGTEGKDPGKRT